MAVCLQCAERRIYNEEALHKWDPVECLKCQAAGVGCEKCEDKTRQSWPALCFKHAEHASVKFKAAAMQKDMERIAARLAKLEEVAQWARALEGIISGHATTELLELRRVLSRLD